MRASVSVANGSTPPPIGLVRIQTSAVSRPDLEPAPIVHGDVIAGFAGRPQPLVVSLTGRRLELTRFG